MGRPFFEVFSELQMDDKIRRLFEDTQITKVSTNSSRDFLRVYLTSDHLIAKEQIRRLEQKMEKDLFDGRMRVYVIEQFYLPDVYYLENLFETYWPSVLSEIHAYSPVLHRILHGSDAHIENDALMLTLADNLIVHEKEDEIRRILEKIFAERCGIPPRLSISYQKQENRSEAEKEKLAKEIHAIVNRRFEAEERQKQAAGEADASPASDTQKKTADPSKRSRRKRIPDSPDLIYGKNFEGTPTPMNQITDGMGIVIVQGRIIESEPREIKGERYIFILTVTDDTDTFRMKFFCTADIAEKIMPELKPGVCICARGSVSFDTFDKDLSISYVTGIRKIPEFRKKREDHSDIKRVELHCHTKMSDMDGVTDVKDLIKQAAAWGQKAIAITDHGDVQAFPDALKASKDVGDDFKVIYGVEGYLVDDTLGLVKNPHGESFEDAFVVFDLETTGLSSESCAMNMKI